MNQNNQQITHTVFMIRPASFGYNTQTAQNNAFQDHRGAEKSDSISQSAIEEFDRFVLKLRQAGIQVLVGLDSIDPKKPDAIFPNNWISFHQDGTVITYPMLAENRRLERNEDYIYTIAHTHQVKRRYTFDEYEHEGMILEGTGSMVLDRQNKIVYACLSPRTDVRLLEKWCVLRSYDKVVFTAKDRNGVAIYHTNVLMAMGTDFVLICLDSIPNQHEKDQLVKSFKKTNKRIIEITEDQLEHFAGNMLQLCNTDKTPYIVMSDQAYQSLRADQILDLEQSGKILFSPIYTIEKYGGGSARCMMAEVFLPEKQASHPQTN